MKKTWQMISKIINKPKNSPTIPSFQINSDTVTDSRIIAEDFNNYFANVGHTLASAIGMSSLSYDNYLPQSPLQSAVFYRTDPLEIIKTITALSNTSSCGYDEIPSFIIKLCAKNISIPLSKLLNHALDHGCFPSDLKIAKVIPIHKSGDTNVMQNYRPISLLTNFAKIFENIIYTRLQNYFYKINIPSSNQFGFQKGKSTSMVVLEILDKIYEGISNKHFTLGVFIDLAKAFDTVDHCILIKKT